jgi:hypothetical protein
VSASNEKLRRKCVFQYYQLGQSFSCIYPILFVVQTNVREPGFRLIGNTRLFCRIAVFC